MNEPTPPARIDAPTEVPGLAGSAAPPDTAAAAPESNFGASLHAAREAAGLSVATLAGRLRLGAKQIVALEAADLATLPSLIYVRGWVRNCARELRIDPAPLLADLDRRAGVLGGAPALPAGGHFPLARLGDSSRPIVVLAIVALVIAGIVGTLWPRRPSPPQPRVDSAVEATPALADPSPAAPEAHAEPPAPAPAPASASATAPAATAASTAASTAGSMVASTATPAVAPSPTSPEPRNAMHAPGLVPPKPTASTALPAPAGGGSQAAGTTAAPAAAVPAAVAAAGAPKPLAGEDTLVLHVHAPSWVEVVQANGTSVFSQICPAGSVQTIHGTAPLRIVIGNAVAVDAQYHGAALDLLQYANINGVARFTLK